MALLFGALVIVGDAILLTFTRAGLMTMAASLLIAVAVLRAQRAPAAATRLVAALAVIIAALLLSSRSSQAMWLRATSEGQESWYRAAIAAPGEIALPAGGVADVAVTLTNTGRLLWDSRAAPPILVSYHWLPADGEGYVAFEGARTAFDAPLAPGAARRVGIQVRAPRRPGRYRIEWDLVQEGRLWFSTEPGAVRTISRASVTGEAPPDLAAPVQPPPRPTVRPGRLVLWRAAAQIATAHPLLGIGPDNFRLAYGAYAGLADADPRTHSNNMYLEILAGGGLAAAAAFAWLAWRAALCFVRLTRAAIDRAPLVALGLAAAGVAIALHAAVDSFVSFAPTYVLFSLTLGCAAACAGGMETGPDAHRV